MNGKDYIEAIQNDDPKKIILECKTEKPSDKNKRITIYEFKDGVVAKQERVSRGAYASGVVYNTQPKEEIKVVEPVEELIYKTDWLDDYFRERDKYENV